MWPFSSSTPSADHPQSCVPLSHTSHVGTWMCLCPWQTMSITCFILRAGKEKAERNPRAHLGESPVSSLGAPTTGTQGQVAKQKSLRSWWEGKSLSFELRFPGWTTDSNPINFFPADFIPYLRCHLPSFSNRQGQGGKNPVPGYILAGSREM